MYAVIAEGIGLVGPFNTEDDAKAFCGIHKGRCHIEELTQCVYEYTITLQRADGSKYKDCLSGTDDEHAFEEASYEFEDVCVDVERGEPLGANLSGYYPDAIAKILGALITTS